MRGHHTGIDSKPTHVPNRSGRPRLDRTRAGVLVGLASALASGLLACGPGGGTSAASNGRTHAVTYVDSRYHYRIDSPGRMIALADGTAVYAGPSQRLQVAVVQGAKAADLAALARDDVAAFASDTATFHLDWGPASISLRGRQLEKFVYSYESGTSPATGKPLTLVGVRYFLPRDATAAAVISYGIVSSQYDAQAADDIASSFEWQ